MTDKVLNINSVLSADSETLKEAKESICRIEESAQRIQQIVSGESQTDIRTVVRRRTDRRGRSRQRLVLLLLSAVCVVAVLIIGALCHKQRTDDSLITLSAEIIDMKSELRQINSSALQSSDLSQ